MARLIDRAYVLGHAATSGHHEGEYQVAASNIGAARASQADFMSIIWEFCRDIVNVGTATPGV